MTDTSFRSPVVGIAGMGDMGSAVARALTDHGVRVLTTVEGRSDRTKKAAIRAGAECLRDLHAVVSEADIFMSILPSDAASQVARAVADAARTRSSRLVYAECNAISPALTIDLGELMSSAGVDFVDAGIIGPPPGVGRPKLFVSGGNAARMAVFNGMGFDVESLGSRVGDASALKMYFSAFNKGFTGLATTIVTAAAHRDLTGPLMAELGARIPALAARAEKEIPYLPIKAGRWSSEMTELAEEMRALSLPDGAFLAAAEIFRLAASTPFAEESRETFDSARGIEDVAKACVEALRQ